MQKKKLSISNVSAVGDQIMILPSFTNYNNNVLQHKIN